MRLLVGCGACAVIAVAPLANAQSKGKRIPLTKGTIFTDGAAVYQSPNFDSPVLTYLDFKTSVRVSKKIYSGVGGMGLFYLVVLPDGKKGYVPDTDVRLVKSSSSREPSPPKAPKEKAGQEELTPEEPMQEEAKSKSQEFEAEQKEPLYFRRYLGGAVSLVNFTEKFSGRKLSDQMVMYGLRMTGPGTLFDGPPLDFNLWFSLQKPGYYSQFTDGPVTGFLLFGDVMAMLPFIDKGNTLVTYGLGLMWTYTRYRVPVAGYSFDSQEIRIGLDGGIGVGQKIGKKYMARLDAKYFYERTQYFGFLVSFQGEY